MRQPDPRPPRQPGASISDLPAARLAAGLLAGALLAAVWAPAARLVRPERARDSFPFSHYPMFSAPRKDTVRLVHMLGRRIDGSLVPLHYSYLGTGGLNQVRRQIRRRVGQGDGQELAEQAAAEVSRRDRPGDRDVIEVRVVKATYGYEAFLAGGHGSRDPQSTRVHGIASVPGRAGVPSVEEHAR